MVGTIDSFEYHGTSVSYFGSSALLQDYAGMILMTCELLKLKDDVLEQVRFVLVDEVAIFLFGE